VAHGEVEVEEGVLVLRRIHVAFTLREGDGAKAGAARRAHEVFKMKCPVYRSIYRAIDITTHLDIVAPAAGSE
jgi:uncharacterized OsmC-like protein